MLLFEPISSVSSGWDRFIFLSLSVARVRGFLTSACDAVKPETTFMTDTEKELINNCNVCRNLDLDGNEWARGGCTRAGGRGWSAQVCLWKRLERGEAEPTRKARTSCSTWPGKQQQKIEPPPGVLVLSRLTCGESSKCFFLIQRKKSPKLAVWIRSVEASAGGSAERRRNRTFISCRSFR